MTNAFSWLGGIIEWFGRWIPRIIIIPATHAGVKFVFGHTIKSLKAGVHIYWPVVTELTTYPVVRQTLNAAPQTLVTNDSKAVMVNTIIVYRIRNIKKALAESWDLEETVSDIVNASVVEAVTSRTYNELISGITTVVTDDLTTRCKKHLEKFGLDVEKVFPTDLAPCRVFKIFGEGGTTDGV